MEPIAICFDNNILNFRKGGKEYEDSLKAYRDVKNSIDTALEKVSTATELPLEEIQKMKE